VTGGPFSLPFVGLVRQNRRGLCPVCGKRHAVCDNPAQPALLYPPLDPRSTPLKPELRFNAPPERREGSAMGLVQSRDLTLRRQEDMGSYVADRRLYLNAEGQVVEAKDPSAVRLLVAEGGTVPLEQARSLGLMNEEQYRKEQGGPRGVERGGYVPHGPGPDDPGAYYDDGTGATPAGNEGYSDVAQPKGSDREKHLANAQQLRVPANMESVHEDAGTPRASVPGQDNAGTVGEPSGDGEEELKRRRAEQDGAKSDAPAEDKAQRAPETKGRSPRSGGSK
jgi:hypothetical protein